MEDTFTPPPHSQNLDRLIHVAMDRVTQGLSPASLRGAYMDWLVHYTVSPGKQLELVQKAMRKLYRCALYSLEAPQGAEPCIKPLPQDRRFSDPAWPQWPFNVLYQSFLLQQQWWHNATTGVRGVTRHHEQVVTFLARQWLDIFSPSNFVLTNPEVLRETFRSGGMNFVQGALNFWTDRARTEAGGKPEGSEAFQVGKNVALTPGRVVYRNRLIELIQYSPATPDAMAEPVLIVPSWIMKYYILDLSPGNSLAKYLVDHGCTVFMVSWKNPDAEDRDLGMDDYLRLGPLAALEAVQTIVPEGKVNLTGYCLGGTLAAIAGAQLARDGDEGSLNSLTLFAGQVDFEEPGELGLFIDESQITFLEDIMWDQGYMTGDEMSGAFTLLNSRDLFWSRLVRTYLLGQREPLTDLMAWNADTTRLPYRMHTEYLRSLYLDNDLAGGRYRVDGRAIALTDIRSPIFTVGTVRDHVSPWKSVYKIHLLTDTDVTFLLTSGGHNAGIVSEPGHRGRSFQLATRRADDLYIDPETWQAATPTQSGSWWPVWLAWLAARSSGRTVPPAMGAPERGLPPLEPAPGLYVLAP